MVGFELRSLGCSSRSLDYYPSNITANWKQLGQAQSNEEPRDRKDSSGTYAPRHQPSAQCPPKSRKMKECVIWAVHTWRKEAAGRGGWALSVQAPHTVRQSGVLEAQHQPWLVTTRYTGEDKESLGSASKDSGPWASFCGDRGRSDIQKHLKHPCSKVATMLK